MDTLADTLWHEFAIETEEHLQAVEPILVQADPQRAGAPDIAQLFRSFHSIKGLARAMDMLGMESVAHHAENLLGLVRDGSARLTNELADLLLQSVDALKRMRDAVAAERRDSPPDPALLARLAAVFAELGGAAEAVAAAAPTPAPGGAPLHEDPEMLAIFVEMVAARGPELCAALGEHDDEREIAAEAAETLAHAAEVMNFEALAAGFGGLSEVVRNLPASGAVDEATRRDLIGRLGDIRLQIELVGDITGQDAGGAAFSAALASRIGDEPHRLSRSLGALNQRLRDDLGDGDHLAVEADAAAIARQGRALRTLLAALALPQAADIMLLVEDLYGRIASAERQASDALADTAEEVFARLATATAGGAAADLGPAEAAELAERLRAPLESTAQKALHHGDDGGRLVAGLHIPAELLTVLSDENLAALEKGIAEGLTPYDLLVHLEADPDLADRLLDWLTSEARTITNRTVLAGGESWFEVLALSWLDAAALAAALLALDPERRCIKRISRLTGIAGGELLLDQPGSAARDGAAPAVARPGSQTNLLRVSGEVVDAFLDDIGELRVTTATLTHLIRGVGSRAIQARARAFVERLPPDLRAEFDASFQDFRERDRRLLETEEQISRMLSRLHQDALELRVVPVDVVFNRLPRVVRDLAQRQGKQVELLLEGRDVRVDKSMVEALADPLLHMVRNAVDHGIEMPEDRRAAGKPERAQLTLRAAQHGSEIHIDVGDDGRGLNAEAIRARAIGRGLVSAAQAAALADAEVYQFIFEAGLSTSPAVTETSGRGVGMDIVLASVRRLNGDIGIRSEPGRGTTFTLVLPVSAALQTALIVRVGDQSLAIPERHVMAVAQIDTATIRLVGSHRSILHRQAVLPLYGLGDLLGMANSASLADRSQEPIVVATNGRQMIGLEVDAIEHRQELFLKDLDPRLASFPGVGGASVLGDGRVVLVLDGEELLQLAARGIEYPAAAARMAS